MTADYGFDPGAQLLRVALHGVVHAQDLMNIVGTTREVDRRTRPKKVVYDCTGIISIAIDGGGVDALASVRPVFEADVVEIILAPQDHIYGLSRMYQTMSAEQRPKLRVTRN